MPEYRAYLITDKENYAGHTREWVFDGKQYSTYLLHSRSDYTEISVITKMTSEFPTKGFVVTCHTHFADERPTCVVTVGDNGEPVHSDGRDGTAVDSDGERTTLPVSSKSVVTLREHNDSIWLFLGDEPVFQLEDFQTAKLFVAYLKNGTIRRQD